MNDHHGSWARYLRYSLINTFEVDPNLGNLTNPRNGRREWYEPITPVRLEWDAEWPRLATQDTPWPAEHLEGVDPLSPARGLLLGCLLGGLGWASVIVVAWRWLS